MATPAVFLRRVKKLPDCVIGGVARAHRSSALGALAAVSKNTPVDTRLARSNWVANIGSIDLSERAIRSFQEVVDEGRATLSESALRSAMLGSGDIVEIHIANGGDKVHYLEYLNRGSSRQAPAGFVQSALFRGGVAGLSRAKLLL